MSFKEHLSADTRVADLLRDYRNAERFIKLCRECPCFARSWLCPPISTDILERMEASDNARIEALKIIPDAECTLSGAEIIQQSRKEFEQKLLDIEKERNGMACGFSGNCPYCGDTPCARLDGKPCRHPEKARPSLEALGFDVAAIAADILGTPIKWEADGSRPPYYMLVGAVFY
ncbi:MAG: DUF2284 domain-containing protein [Muribaculaceae bacterium]|nr:DUF2284 domain-containing protein [Muribaculaceae bacterium]